MRKKKSTRPKVKDRLLNVLIEHAGEKDWSKLTITELIEKSGVARASFYRNYKSVEEIIDYGIEKMVQCYHEGNSFSAEDSHSREAMIYKFQFYQKNADLVRAFHHAVGTALLDAITDCEFETCGDMPVKSISKYKHYCFAGAFYNMMLYWIESGMEETPEDMADEFLRAVNNNS